MKTYTVTFTPNATAPAGNLGKPDFFGFKIEAITGRDALEIARVRFDETFPHLAAHYTGTLETI